MVYLWRAVDDEGTILDVIVQRKRNTKATTRLLRKIFRNQGIKPTCIVTDRLGSYGAALKQLGMKHLQGVGGRKTNRAECSHVPIRRRERKAQNFKSVRNAQKLLSAYARGVCHVNASIRTLRYLCHKLDFRRATKSYFTRISNCFIYIFLHCIVPCGGTIFPNTFDFRIVAKTIRKFKR